MKAAKVPSAKKQAVESLSRLAKDYPLIGVVNLENLPAKQLQSMRTKLRGKVEIVMRKKTLMSLALKKSGKKNVEDLIKHFKGMSALIFTKDNPFSLFKTLKASQSKAPIKAGQVAPDTITVPAGPTSFAPGPIIGELGALGIKSGVENGKIAIKVDSEVAKEGDVISDKLAGILTRLGIEPMKIGLDLIAVYEDGEILTKDALDVDEEAYKNDILSAVTEVFNLAMFIGFPTTETTIPLISKAVTEARNLAMEAKVYTKETIKEIIAMAHNQGGVIEAKKG